MKPVKPAPAFLRGLLLAMCPCGVKEGLFKLSTGVRARGKQGMDPGGQRQGGRTEEFGGEAFVWSENASSIAS